MKMSIFMQMELARIHVSIPQPSGMNICIATLNVKITFTKIIHARQHALLLLLEE